MLIVVCFGPLAKVHIQLLHELRSHVLFFSFEKWNDYSFFINYNSNCKFAAMFMMIYFYHDGQLRSRLFIDEL